MKWIIEITIQIDNFSKNRGFSRMYWITQILAWFTGISTLLFLVINTIFHINIFPVIIFPLFILWMMSLILDVIGWTLLNTILISLKKQNIELWEIQGKIEELWEILIISNNTLQLIQKLAKFKYFVKIFYPRKIQSYNKIFNIQYSVILLILTDLRSDLLIRLTEQQESLKSAKSEVESHIKWTIELDQVSELQRIRLDKQIEQFEELQRVLVKV